MTTLNKIQELEDMMSSIKARLDHVEQVLNIESDTAWESDMSDIDDATMAGSDMAEVDNNWTAGDIAHDSTYPGYADDTTLGANDIEHTHEDGTTHSHPGGDVEHTHDHIDDAVVDTTDLDHSNAAAYDTLPSDSEPPAPEPNENPDIGK